jgi:hypothetical protein
MILARPERTNHTREELAARLRADDPPHVARFGDGEVIAAMHWSGEPDLVRHPFASEFGMMMERAVLCNADNHSYSPSLGKAVTEALATFAKRDDVWLGNWYNWPLGAWIHGFVDYQGGHEHWIEHDVFTHIEQLDPQPTRDIFIAVRDSSRRKVLVGPGYLSRLHKWIGLSSHVRVSSRDGWSDYGRVREVARAEVRPGDLVLLVYGMPAKPLMADLLCHVPGAVYWDVGSGLDPLVGRRTRGNQISPTRLRRLYDGDMPRVP